MQLRLIVPLSLSYMKSNSHLRIVIIYYQVPKHSESLHLVLWIFTYLTMGSGSIHTEMKVVAGWRKLHKTPTLKQWMMKIYLILTLLVYQNTRGLPKSCAFSVWQWQVVLNYRKVFLGEALNDKNTLCLTCTGTSGHEIPS